MEKNGGAKAEWPPEETSLNVWEKAAYRRLLYEAMLDIRNLCQSRGPESRNPFEWWRQYRRSRVAGALADWLHNLAAFASRDFEGFSADRFWREYGNLKKRFPDAGRGVLDYRRRYEEPLARLGGSRPGEPEPWLTRTLKPDGAPPMRLPGMTPRPWMRTMVVVALAMGRAVAGAMAGAILCLFAWLLATIFLGDFVPEAWGFAGPDGRRRFPPVIGASMASGAVLGAAFGAREIRGRVGMILKCMCAGAAIGVPIGAEIGTSVGPVKVGTAAGIFLGTLLGAIAGGLIGAVYPMTVSKEEKPSGTTDGVRDVELDGS